MPRCLDLLAVAVCTVPLLAALAPPALAAPPSNDGIENRVTIPVRSIAGQPFFDHPNTADATRRQDDPPACVPYGHSV